MNKKYYKTAFLSLAAAAVLASCGAELDPWYPPEGSEMTLDEAERVQAAHVELGPAGPGLTPHENGSENPVRPGEGPSVLIEPRTAAVTGALAPDEESLPADDPPKYEEIPGGYATFDNTPVPDGGPGPDPDIPLRNDAGDDIGTPGFWCNQIRFALSASAAAHFTTTRLLLWVLKINHASRVFSEMREVRDLDEASELLCSPEGDLSPDGKLQRHLLTLWLNLVSRQVLWETRLDELCFGSVPLPPDAGRDWTILQVLEWSEDVLVDGMPNDGSELFWKDVIDTVNNAQAPGAGDCEAP